MKIAVLSMSSVRPDEVVHPGFKYAPYGVGKLLESTAKFGYDHHMLFEKTSFGGQMPVVVRWCRENRDKYTHVLYTDAFDTVALAGPAELQAKIDKHFTAGVKFIGSGEKNVFPPSAERRERYHTLLKDFAPERPWQYVNGGQWFAEIEWFLAMVDLIPLPKVTPEVNDQTWLSDVYLHGIANGHIVTLDYGCHILQSIAFEDDGDFACTRDGRIINRLTGSMPVWFHDNGNKGDPLSWVYRVIDEGVRPRVPEFMANLLAAQKST